MLGLVLIVHGFVLLRWLLALVALYCGTVCSTLVVWVIRPNQRSTQQALKHLADRNENGEHISHSPLLPYQMSDLKCFSFPKEACFIFQPAGRFNCRTKSRCSLHNCPSVKKILLWNTPNIPNTTGMLSNTVCLLRDMQSVFLEACTT